MHDWIPSLASSAASWRHFYRTFGAASGLDSAYIGQTAEIIHGWSSSPMCSFSVGHARPWYMDGKYLPLALPAANIPHIVVPFWQGIIGTCHQVKSANVSVSPSCILASFAMFCARLSHSVGTGNSASFTSRAERIWNLFQFVMQLLLISAVFDATFSRTRPRSSHPKQHHTHEIKNKEDASMHFEYDHLHLTACCAHQNRFHIRRTVQIASCC